LDRGRRARKDNSHASSKFQSGSRRLEANNGRCLPGHEPAVIICQRGEPVVVLSLDDYNALNETVYLLGTEANTRRLRESIAKHKAGKNFLKNISLNLTEADQT
jgi:antitoxin YefM